MEPTIALVQMEIAPMDPLRNLGRMEHFVAKAKAEGADLVVFPEDAVCGPLGGQTAFVQHAPEYQARMQALAARHAVDLVPGSWTVAESGLLFNQAHYINADGSLAGIYRKVNLWETERVHITPGTAAGVFATRFGQVGMIICWDISFPGMFASMVGQGVQLVISPSYWSFPRSAQGSDALQDEEILLIDSLCTTRAFENDVVFAYCNAAGTLQQPGIDTVLSGRSQLTHPRDKVLAKCAGNDEEMLVAQARLPPRATATRA
jgi:predicted amidohydrolase